MSPAELASRCDPRYVPARHHLLLSAIAAHAIRAGGARLIVNLPPRHGKSRLFAVETPLWEMLRRPGAQTVVASYALDLAERHSREARERVANDRFQQLTSARLKPDHSGAADWALTTGSSFKAVGVGGALTGHGADLLILDDLHKDAAEANSPTMRQRVWDWLQSVAMTRLSPGASVILIGTRWHQDDVMGRLLAQSGDRWTLINLPALAHPGDELGRTAGDALWPDRFPIQSLLEIRQSVSPYFWSALYDGNPIPDSGNHVQIDRFQVRQPSEVPAGMRCVRFWDLAVTEKRASDYTAGALCGITPQGDLWILDVTRDRMEWPRVRDTICQRAPIDRCQVGIESVGTQGGLVQNLREVFPAEFCLTETTPEKDKLTRALPWFTRVNSGRCYIVAGAWNTAFLDECQAFPLGAHDDQVDAVSGAAAMLAGGVIGSPLVPELPVERMRFSRRERGVFL